MTAIALIGALASCSPGGESESRQASADENAAQLKGAIVTGVEVRPSEESDREVEVWVSGVLPDGCTRIGGVSQRRDGDAFTLTLETTGIEQEGCQQDERAEFIQIVPIEIVDLEPGLYFVWAGDLGASFEVAK